ncbi:MAG TPA: type II toxin-antitoxin system RelE/ParE family toxin [Crocinitomicaceae bacterium]|nr:type II toxin-antitoxin system RelE/ParE family toxin [Crocinitomicaceae bacterium]
MEIEWTKIALKNIKKIHAFYKKTANKEIADKIIGPIFSLVQNLKNQSNIGQQEESLKHLKLGHRYLVLGHNKIIYTQKENTIYITHVFDTRQNPKKLK